jgi:hypothetical protein
MTDVEYLMKQAELLAPRLAKLKADGFWAHRASGCRRALLRHSNRIEKCLQDGGEPDAQDIKILEQAIVESRHYLRKAALEIPAD